MQRIAVKRETRNRVLERYNYTCQFCSRKFPEVTVEVDHIQSVSQGGSDLTSNLTALCKECNRRKGSSIYYNPFEDSKHSIHRLLK